MSKITEFGDEEEGGIELPFKEPEQKEEKESEPIKEEEKEQDTQTLQPVLTFAKENKEIVGALGVIIVLIILLTVSIFRKKKHHQSEKKEEQEKQATISQVPPTDKEENHVPIKVSCLHEIGARADQQDSYGISEYAGPEKGMFAVVADGMGGLTNGKAVSSLIIKTCMNVFYSLPNYVSYADMLLQMAVSSNNAVNQMLGENGKSGSTLVAASVAKGKLHFLTIGDSRIYLYRGGALLQLNREHIYREELILQALHNRMSIQQTNQDPQAGSVTSYLGIGYVPHLDRNFEGIKLLNKDKIILMSDGVFGTLSQEQMESALALPAEQAAQKLQEMIKVAAKKYQDNYTAIVLEYCG